MSLEGFDVKQVKRCVVLGARKNKGTFDGRAYDYTELAVEHELESGAESRGCYSSWLRWGDSTNFDHIKHLPFPLAVEADVEEVVDAKGQTRVKVLGLRAVGRVERKFVLGGQQQPQGAKS